MSRRHAATWVHIALVGAALGIGCESDPPGGTIDAAVVDAQIAEDAMFDGSEDAIIDGFAQDMVDAVPETDAMVDAPDDAMVRPATDAIPDTIVDAAAHRRVRTPCFVGEPIEPAVDPRPETCAALYAARPDLETGCYLLDDGTGAPDETYCWRRRALVLLVNNDIDGDIHPDDTDGDGVIDRGPMAGTNHPGDPLADTPAEVAERLRREVADWFAEVSYGALWVDLSDIHWAPGGEDGPDRWFRLQRERPGFAHAGLFAQVCAQRGGMTAADWRRYDFIVTIITDGTVTSGSQKRTEALPIGDDCADTVDIRSDYLVVKRFSTWARLGTLFHELGHGLARDPLDEPSVGHSEATHAIDGTHAEYGDLTDVMGESSNRGRFSLPQTLFLRFLPRAAVVEVPSEAGATEVTLHPLERDRSEVKGALIRVDAGRTYYVEARRPIGDDSRLAGIFHDGVLIKRADDVVTANKSWIVDPTPETPTVRSDDSVLLPGRTFTDRDNALSISLLASDDDGATIEVRRGPPSDVEPVVEGVDVQVDGRTVTLVATARPGDPDVPPGDLLYFWKPTAPDAPYTAGVWRAGPEVRFAAAGEPRQVWLLVSDRRGGQVWTPVNVPAAR